MNSAHGGLDALLASKILNASAVSLHFTHFSLTAYGVSLRN